MHRLSKIKLFFILYAAGLLAAANVYAYTLEFPLPGMQSVSDPGEYISLLFVFGLGLVGFLAVAAIVVGGIMYMTGSTVGKVDKAKQIIWGAVSGLVLLLCSYLLLFTIDPTLVNLSPFQLKPANIPAQQGGTQCTAPQVFDPTTDTCVTSAMVCDPATQVWSPTQGTCVNKPPGYGTTACNPAASPCAGETACVPGGCAVGGFQQWDQAKCCCVISSGYGAGSCY